MAGKRTPEPPPTEPAPTAPTQEDVDRAVYEATHTKDGKPKPITPYSGPVHR